MYINIVIALPQTLYMYINECAYIHTSAYVCMSIVLKSVGTIFAAEEGCNLDRTTIIHNISYDLDHAKM